HAGPGPAAACSGGPGGGDGGAVRGQIGGGVAQADRLRVRREVPQVAVRGDENQPGTDVVELVVPGTDRHAGVPDRAVPALAAPPAAFAVVVEVAARQDRRGGENGAVVRDGTDGQTARCGGEHARLATFRQPPDRGLLHIVALAGGVGPGGGEQQIAVPGEDGRGLALLGERQAPGRAHTARVELPE